MAELKTKSTQKSVIKFIESVENKTRREDALVLLKLFKKITGEKPVLWSNNTIGFGSYHYKSSRSSQEGDWPTTGFSPRKANTTIYIMPGFSQYADLLNKLGKYKSSVSCLYINKLADVDLKVLETLIEKAYKYMQTEYQHC